MLSIKCALDPRLDASLLFKHPGASMNLNSYLKELVLLHLIFNEL